MKIPDCLAILFKSEGTERLDFFSLKRISCQYWVVVGGSHREPALIDPVSVMWA